MAGNQSDNHPMIRQTEHEKQITKMKKITLLLCLGLLSALCCRAQVPPLKFDKNGDFKIVQFTDVHFKYGNPASNAALKRINEVLDAERPQLVVFTGDVIYSAPADTAMRTVLDCVSSRRIPFVVTFGNHDDEQGKTRAELYDVIRTVPFNLHPERGGADSPDYVLTMKSSDVKGILTPNKVLGSSITSTSVTYAT